MGVRTRLFLICLLFGIVPLVALYSIGYYRDAQAIRELVGRSLTRDVGSFVRSMIAGARDRGQSLNLFAESRGLRDFLEHRPPENNAAAGGAPLPGLSSDRSLLPADLVSAAKDLYAVNREDFIEIAVFDSSGKPVLYIHNNGGVVDSADEGLKFDTSYFPESLHSIDRRVFAAGPDQRFSPELIQRPFGIVLRYIQPVRTGQPTEPVRFAIQFERMARSIFTDAAEKQTADLAQFPSAAESALASRSFVALDRDKTVMFHSNTALLFQSADDVMPPSFRSIADQMAGGQRGVIDFTGVNSDDWTVAFAPVPDLGVSVGAEQDMTTALGKSRRSAMIGIGVGVILWLFAAAFISYTFRNIARSIERVAEGAAAISDGDLHHHIDTTTSGETKHLAESFNRMSDRLNEQITKRTESKQFESFTRLSAMLTHDLKNAISALSLLVGNLDKQFHKEEFRRDAMESLIELTDKLSKLVSKLSGPIQSLSGEHQRPRPANLVPIVQGVLSSHFLSRASRNMKSVVELPDQLIAVVDVERIEKVIENLVINAIEAMSPSGGVLTIEGGSATRNQVFFKVSDTGPGMSQAFVETSLFRAFATTKRDGMGLGLYTCREVVRAHGGTIEVEKSSASGTTFRVVLPSAM